jgi:L-seryl-tRNA(Ser) seleniumtransferase
VVERLRRHPLARALRVDKLTLAALEATLTGPPTPTALALHAGVSALRARAENLARRLRDHGLEATARDSDSVVGGGGAPGVVLPSAAVVLPHGYAEPLRTGTPAVLGRVEQGALLLDLRCVPAGADDTLYETIVRTAP